MISVLLFTVRHGSICGLLLVFQPCNAHRNRKGEASRPAHDTQGRCEGLGVPDHRLLPKSRTGGSSKARGYTAEEVIVVGEGEDCSSSIGMAKRNVL